MKKEIKKKEFCFITIIEKGRGIENSRSIGFLSSLKQAQNLILNRTSLITESGYYQYAVIEKFGFGIYYYSEFQEWYKLYKTKAVKIKTPMKYKQICNFGIG